MKHSGKIFLFLLLLLTGGVLRGDALDDMDRTLDVVERNFWAAQLNTNSDFYQSTLQRLNDLARYSSKIQSALVKKRLLQYSELSSSVSVLQRNFGSIKSATLRRFSFRSFKYTSMRNYSKEFNQLLRRKAESENEGKDKGKKRSRRKGRTTPTLSNVDIIEYERWLVDICSANVESFVRRKNNGNRSEKHRVEDMVSSCFSAIQSLRITMAKIRQETKLKF